MHCPLCAHELHPLELEPGLPAARCPRCTGHWLRLGDYANWRAAQPRDLPVVAGASPPAEVGPDGALLKQCPDCGQILTRFRVGHGVTFRLEQCRRCQGVWFDGSEWDILRARNLHDDLHVIFSDPWQHTLAAERSLHRTEAQFEQWLGVEGYERVREMKAWVDSHPYRTELLAYLQRPNPRRSISGAASGAA